MINLHPYLEGSTQFRVGLQYTDCGGNWGYGVAVDNIRIKEGDDFTWLTVSPYSGTVDLGGTAHDSIQVKVGMYGVYDGFSIEDELLIDGISRLTIPDEYSITVQLAVGATVSLEEPQITPFEFALHQNYPNLLIQKQKFSLILQRSLTLIFPYLIWLDRRLLLSRIGLWMLESILLRGVGKIMRVLLPSGMYFYEMNTSSYHSIKKLVLVK